MSVEVFDPQTNKTNKNCTLRDLPNPRFGHTLCGGLICGGIDNSYSCLLWRENGVNSSFVPTEVKLIRPRAHHLCWELPVNHDDIVLNGGTPVNHGIVLIGGTGGSKTSELVVSDGSSSIPFFDLQYPAE